MRIKVLPFSIGPYDFKDFDDLTLLQKHKVEEAISRTYAVMPEDGKCGSDGRIGTNSCGDESVKNLKLAVFKTEVLQGAFYLGSIIRLGGTSDEPIISVRPMPAFPDMDVVQLQKLSFIFAKWMLNNPLVTNAGKLIISRMEYAIAVSQTPSDNLVRKVHEALINDPDLKLSLVPAPKDVTITLATIEKAPIRIRRAGR